MEKKIGGERKFVLQVLPWILGASALVVYLLTFDPWLTFLNTTTVARLSGWQWYPELYRPAYFLVTYPLHWLPGRYIPLGLNLFTVLCAAVTIGQLARSVALLPFDRTQDQRLRERSPNSLLSLPLAWIPPVVAATACGLQLTFWEYATSGSGIVFNVLLFSYLVRTVLEYRNSGGESRLTWFAFVCGVGMANDTAMIGFFPLFVAALLWLRGMSFFNFRFLLRVILFGLLGLSTCLLLPFLASHGTAEGLNFWPAFKLTFFSHKALIVAFPKKTLLVLAASTVVPAILIFIRWAYGFGDNSQLGTALTTFIFHIVHAMFLTVCIWTIFDSPLSPRERGAGYPFLPFYFLGSLSIGYFCGYFLLVFRRVSSSRPSPILKVVNLAATAAVVALLIIVPVGLLAKNLSYIREGNGPTLKRFAAAMVEGLPKSAVLFCDDMYRLALVHSLLQQESRDSNFFPVETQWLRSPIYQHYLQKAYPTIWPADEMKIERLLGPIDLVHLVSTLTKTNEVYYLHPSFGYYFESFYQEPHELVYRLRHYPTNSLLSSPWPPEILQENNAFWARSAEKDLPAITAITQPPPPETKPSLRARLCKSFRISNDPNPVMLIVGAYYSRPLNVWAVELQKLNQLKKAGEFFQLALDLKPDNVVAEINLECNTNLLAGNPPPLKPTKYAEDLFGKFRSWDDMMNQGGPFDDPSFCFAASMKFAASRLYRQAILNLDRVHYFAPSNINVTLQLAQISLLVKYPDQVLTYVQDIRNHPDRYHPTSTNLLQLDTLEGAAHLLRNETEAGAALLEGVANSGTNNPHLLEAIFNIYCKYGLYTNALAILDRQLAANAEDVSALINKGYVYSRLKEYDKAIPPLTQALTIQTNNPKAMFNRAIARLYNNDLNEAQADYEKLQDLYPKSYQIYYGLAEIAVRRKDTNSAIRNYEAYLTNAIPNAPETLQVQSRLKELKGEKEPKAAKTK